MHIFSSARLWLSWRYKGLLNIWKGPRWVPMKRQTHRQPRGVSGRTPCFLILQNDLQVCEIINDFNFSDDPSGGKKIRRLRENIWKILDLLYKTDSKRNLLLKKIHGKWCQDTKNNNKKVCVITQQQPNGQESMRQALGNTHSMTSDWLPNSSSALDRVRRPTFSATLAAQEVSEEHGLWGQEGLGSNSSSFSY